MTSAQLSTEPKQVCAAECEQLEAQEKNTEVLFNPPTLKCCLIIINKYKYSPQVI